MKYTKRNARIHRLLVIFLLALGVLVASGPASAGDDPSILAQRPAQQTLFSTYLDEGNPPGSGDLEPLQQEGGEADPQPMAVCAPDIPNMVGYWPLDDVDTPVNNKLTFVNNLGTSNGTCTIPGCPTKEPLGKVNGAYKFLYYDPYGIEEDAPDKIDVPKFAALDWTASESFSFETWVKIPPPLNCSGRRVFVGRRGQDTPTVFSIWLGCENGTNKAMFSVRDSIGTIFDVQGTTAINDGDWHHVVGVRDAAANKLNLFVDGVQEGSINAVYTAVFSNGKDLSIGYFNTGFPPHYYFEGSLDEVAVYKKALTLGDVLSHYNNGNGKSYCSAGPVVINPGNQQKTEGDLVTLQITASDPATGTLNYSATGLPSALSINNNGVISGQIGCDASTGSPYSVTVTVTNTSTSKTGSAAFFWTVTDKPDCDPQSKVNKVYMPITLR